VRQHVDADQRTLDAALEGLRVGFRNFGAAGAGGDFAQAERWAAFCFRLWEAFQPVDPQVGGWCARLVFLEALNEEP
jgi:hypothetical protein